MVLAELIKDNIGTLVGLLGLAIGLISYFSGRNESKKAKMEKELNKYITETALKNMNKDITEAEIATLENQKTELQNIIENKLPREARRKELLNKIDFYKKQILDNYVEYVKLSVELEDIPQNDIPPNILDIINNKIMPDATEKKNSERSIVLLALLFVAYIFAGSIPIISNFRIILLAFAVKPVVVVVENYFKDHYKNIVRKLIILANIAFSLYALIIAYGLFDSSLTRFFSSNRTTYVIDKDLSTIIFIIVILALFVWFTSSTMYLIGTFVTEYRGKSKKTELRKNRISKAKIVIILVIAFLLFMFGILMLSVCIYSYYDYTYEIRQSDYINYHIAFSAICMAISLLITTFLFYFRKKGTGFITGNSSSV